MKGRFLRQLLRKQDLKNNRLYEFAVELFTKRKFDSITCYHYFLNQWNDQSVTIFRTERRQLL